SLESRGSAGAADAGLAKPSHTIDLVTTGGKTNTLLVGDKSAVGDNLYVSRKDQGRALVVSADLLERLDKPASDYRSKKLVEMSTSDITRLEIDKPGGKVVLARAGSDWKVIEPQQFPAEKADVDNILFDLTGLRANEFVSENATADAAGYSLDQPRITATLSTTKPALPVGIAAPTTAPAAPTSQLAPLVVKFGRYDDVLKKNIYVMTSQSPVVATVGANVLETINMKPIELRDRKVFELDPQEASAIAISSDLAATTRPTSRPASKKEVVLKRRKTASATQAAGEAAKPQAATAPATQAATQLTAQVASTQPATQPATQASTKWEVVASATETKPADDAKIDALLAQLHPLRAQKYLESAPVTQPTTQPAASYVLKVTTEGPGGTPVNHYELKLTDPGNAQPLIGSYNELAFEMDRSVVDRLSGDFLKGSAPPPHSFANEGLPDATIDPVGP
ncbi:MAG: DUF4340 domain-containing protein, partial [Tepidisphaeraceae bacterium]